MNEDARNEKIQAYIEGRLTDTDLSDFKKRLSQDNELAREVRELQLIEKDLNSNRLGDFRGQMSDWESEYRQALETPPAGFQLKRYLSIAATIAILAVAAIYLTKPASNDALFDNYYSPYEDVLSTRGESEDQLLSEGLTFYNASDYSRAAEKLGKYVETNSEPLAYLYLGISYLELDQPMLAQEVLKRAEFVSYTSQQANWYLGLSYLKQDNIEIAKSYFTKIANNEAHYKNSQASEILKALN